MNNKIIVADDAPIIRLMIKDILEFNKYEVIAECENGQQAVDKYKELKPDLITLDIIMPEKDGLQALEEIMAFDKNAKAIMVTAIDQRESLMKAIRLGATDYIVKPFEDARVISAVKKALGS